MTEKNIIDVNEENFNQDIIEASEKKLIIVDFWAPWCGPCKQLTPILEKIAGKSVDKITLAKINIDENQQIASQLRIQSIPTVFAFKNKQIANAFQGAVSEKQIIDFIEKALGEKLEDDFDSFFESISDLINNKDHENAKNALLEFLSNNTNNVKAISLLLECNLELNEYEEAEELLESLEKEIKENKEISKITKRLSFIKKDNKGPSLDELQKKLLDNPKDIELLLDISEKYFSKKEYSNAFEILLEKYPTNKEKVKLKMLEFFEALGGSHEMTIEYRKKLSSLMFS